ncbi:hypothetical protein G7Z17_g616 [Cylindrodendrum hubeiense]|uniref:Uncharacterized protein n=1 Tax=Cylindrodendrum hubeiense TaxID=595255 RepID=A0A9P5LG69_9HYPO|nr:hypothetical protein G7Z17_g616 [Cylindrodendrum hubeiense]
MSLLVGKGDTIHFSENILDFTDGTLDATKLTISWKQMGRTRTETYIRCRFTVTSSERKDGQLFIQASKLQALIDKQDRDGPMIAVKVGDDFQFGQNQGRTERFLVFHDKNNKPYQHRFVEQLLVVLGDQAIDWARNMGFEGIESIRNKAADIIGEYLRDF